MLMELAALVIVLGMLAQWLAWRLRLPALLILMAVGLALGPGFELVTIGPEGKQALQPVISLAVALILFEGGLTLRWHELRGVNKAIWRLVIVAGPLAWALGFLAARYVGGFTLPSSIILGGLLVVTGPTVVIPLLRQANLNTRIARILRWEGIVNDPSGAMLAVLALELVRGARLLANPATTLAEVAAGSAFAGIMGYFLARLYVRMVNRSAMAEYLYAPVLMAAVLGLYVAMDMVQSDTGLVAVTVMGITLANSRLFCLEDILRFKEGIAIFLTSALFIALSASVSRADLHALQLGTFAFVVVMIVLVRPVAVWVGLTGIGLNWKEKLFIGLIAPRGIVALSVAGYFSSQLAELRVPGADEVLNATFLMVLVTVSLASLLTGPLARRLELARARRNGVVIAGSYPWSAAFAAQLLTLNVPVLIVDGNWRRLKAARMQNVPVYYGSLLSEYAEVDLDLTEFRYFMAATDNDAFNTLLCSQQRSNFPMSDVFQLKVSSEDIPAAMHEQDSLRGRAGFGGITDWEALTINAHMGWVFRKTTVNETYTYEKLQADMPAGGILIGWVGGNGIFRMAGDPAAAQPEKQATFISFVPPKVS